MSRCPRKRARPARFRTAEEHSEYMRELAMRGARVRRQKAAERRQARTEECEPVREMSRG